MRGIDQSDWMQSRLLWSVIGPVALFVLVVALYAPSMSNDFIYDDHELILEQVTPHSAGDFFAVFAKRHWYNLPYYRPVSRLTMVAQKFLNDDHPGPYHLFNIILTGIGALLVYALLRLPVFGIPPLIALLGSALFAVHPITSACVYPICSGRETLMPVVFIIATVYAFLHSGKGWYVGALALFFVSLLCKELAVVVPGLFVLVDVLRISPDSPGRSGRKWLSRYVPVGIVLLLYLLIRSLVFSGTSEIHVAIFQNPLGPLLTLLYTLQTTFVPFAQLVYEPRVEVWWSTWRLFVWPIVVGLVAVGVYRCWPSVRKAVLFWLGWFFLALLPMANVLVQEAHFAERYGFLALVGVVGIVGALVSVAWERPALRPVMTIFGVILLVACSMVSLHRRVYFRNDLAFLRQWAHTDPRSPQAHLSLGDLYLEQKDLDEAMYHLKRALSLNPNWDKAENILGVIYKEKGKFGQATFHLRRAIQINPDFSDAHMNLGDVLVRQRRLDDAIKEYRLALQLAPDSFEGHNNLGFYLAKAGRTEEAIREYRETLRLNPDFVDAYINLGNALFAEHKGKEAVKAYREALRIRPDYEKAHYNMGIALAIQGKFEEAIRHYSEVLRIRPDSLGGHYNMGIALAAQGRLDKAIHQYYEALRLNPDFVGAHFELGKVFSSQGRLQEAMREYREALRIMPDFVGAHMNLGNILVSQGKLDEAIKHYREVLRIMPDYADARENLKKALVIKKRDSFF